jgi:hypothetical protein
VLLLEKGAANLCEHHLSHTADGEELEVKMGEIIGTVPEKRPE